MMGEPVMQIPPPQDWPVEHLLRGRAELERWCHEQGILDGDQQLVIEVRARPARQAFGMMPRAALVVHHGLEGWLP